jgi:endonuclease/exonuclease/phosphatase family metal-dependent hydrolase
MQMVYLRSQWILGFALWLGLASGCGFEVSPPEGDSGNGSGQQVSAQAAPGDAITIASFNIQVFGTSKIEKPEVMDILTKVVRRLDLVAVQEIRSKDQDVIPRFIEMINADGSRYDYVIGPRLGRTSSKEQYAFLYNTARVELIPDSVYTVPDPQDRLHREPLVARFRVRGLAANEAFTFSLVNIHTDPDETDTELDALDDVFVSVQQNGSGEDDVILLGDLNVDEYHLGELGRLPNVVPVISDMMTNTRGNRAYDNFVLDRTSTVEYTGRHGVWNLQGEFNLNMEQTLNVSDHLPIWAEFSSREGGGALASRPGAATPAR